ncbi:MAG: outer membrane beta-barrel protein, partial [Bacteroidales bacterium]|nr:outer membrane beta-barrel protein [Bacteroidales bacterium]
FSKFIKKLHKSKKLRPHDGGFALGFHNLASRDLSHIGTAQDAELRTSSFELQFKLCGLSLPLSKKYGWLFFSGLGIRHAQYHSDFNTTFHKVNNATVQVEAPGGILYKKTRIQTWAVTIPLMFEWQKKVGKRPIYVQGGVEAAVLFYAASKVKFDDGLHRRTQKKYEYGMNINPLQVDAKIGIGYGHVGLYVRYGLLSLFRSGRGPEVVPAAVGVVWNW